MIRLFLISLLLIGIQSHSSACDFCNNLSTINPYYTGKNRLSFNYLYQHSESEELTTAFSGFSKLAHGSHGSTAAFKEFRHTWELSWMHHLNQNWSINLTVPYQMNILEETGTLTTRWMGDVGLMGYYILSSDADKQTWYRFILVGFGVEIPTGNNELESKNIRLHYDQQIGSGSWDILMNLAWIGQFSDWTVTADGYGKWNGKNKFEEQIGPTISFSSGIAHDLWRDNSGAMALTGTGGFRYEFHDSDRKNSTAVVSTGSETVFLQAGIKFFFQSARVNFTMLSPIWTERPPSLPEEHARLSGGIGWEW